jgi:high potential iron-sulfur protein
MTRPSETTRRRFLKFVAGAATLPTVGSLLRAGSAMATESKQLDEADPAAAALGYKKDTTQVDPAKYPQHQATQDCSGCRYYQGKAGSEWAACTIFPGKGSVHTRGWCAAYAAK